MFFNYLRYQAAKTNTNKTSATVAIYKITVIQIGIILDNINYIIISLYIMYVYAYHSSCLSSHIQHVQITVIFSFVQLGTCNVNFI